MKRLISLFIATAAILCACCGVFYAQKSQYITTNTSPAALTTEISFSLEIAKDSLKLSSYAAQPLSLSTALEERGYSDIEFFGYEHSLKSDNKAGLALAQKEGSLIAVIRGTDSEEWYSNFYVGDGSEHAGFSFATDAVLKNIKSYINTHNIDPALTSIFFTGHSRGAAVSNMAAARLIDKQSFKNVSAYTFACPNTTTLASASDGKYNSIINISNPEDFICYIPLAQWGYTKYGITLSFPENDGTEEFKELYRKMEDAYFKSTKTRHKGFENGSTDVVSMVNYLYSIAPTPYDYYNKELSVAGYRLTMYDYMMKLAAVMNEENMVTHGMFMLCCKSIPEVAPITKFMFSGMEQSEIKKVTSLENTAVVLNHLIPAYSAWMSVLPDSYYINIK